MTDGPKKTVKEPEEPEQGVPKPVPAWRLYLSDANAGVRQTFNDAWMVTFTDLVALMLAFFVLMFSMSSVDRFKWANLVRSLAGEMESIQARVGSKPAEEFQIEHTDPLPGTDLDYLTPIVAQRVAAEPALSAGVVWRAKGRTVVSFPTAMLFAGGETALTRRTNPAVYALSRLVQSFDNLVEVHGHSEALEAGAPDSQAWSVTLLRASSLADSLVEAGYRGRIVARGYGSSRQGIADIPGIAGNNASLGNRMDIVIHEDTPQVPTGPGK